MRQVRIVASPYLLHITAILFHVNKTPEELFVGTGVAMDVAGERTRGALEDVFPFPANKFEESAKAATSWNSSGNMVMN